MTTIPPEGYARRGRSAAMLREMAKTWWILLLRGIVAIGFSVLAFIWPGLTLLTFVVVYGVYAFIDGLLALVSAVIGGAPAPRWWLAAIGLLGMATGILTFAWPGITALVLLFFIAGWAIAVGIFQIIGAIRLRKEIENEWFLILCGIISALFGIGILLAPGAGALALVWVIGFYAVLQGILYIRLAFRLKRHS
jgi:uncharacterized membrane protein HdeD (DUF308 family)